MRISLFSVGLLLSVSASASLALDSYGTMTQRNVAKYRLAVQKNPNDAQAQERLAYFLYCTNYKQVGNAIHCDPAPLVVQDEALGHLERAIALQPNHYDWQSTLGMYLSNRSRYAEALPHLKNPCTC